MQREYFCWPVCEGCWGCSDSSGESDDDLPGDMIANFAHGVSCHEVLRPKTAVFPDLVSPAEATAKGVVSQAKKTEKLLSRHGASAMYIEQGNRCKTHGLNEIHAIMI